MSRPSRRNPSPKSDPKSPKSSPRRGGSGRPSRAKKAAAEKAEPSDDDEDLPTLEPMDDEDLPTLEPMAEDAPGDVAGDDEDLPTLEPMDDGDELETLEPLPEDLATVTVSIPEETFEYEVRLDVALTDPSTEKAEVPAAIEGPLHAAAKTHAAVLRWRRVEVRFVGETLVPSAAKECIAKALGSARPLTVTVQRGYGNELVLENTRPNVSVDLRDEGDSTVATIPTAELEATDMEFLLPAELEKSITHFEGRNLIVKLDCGAELLPRGVRTALRDLGRAANARSVQVRTTDGEATLFDRDLESRATFASGSEGYDRDLKIKADGDAERLEQSLDLALQSSGPLADKRIAVRCQKGTLTPAERTTVLARLARQKPRAVDLFGDDGMTMIFPPLLQGAASKSETTIRVGTKGRNEAAVVEAFDRELERMLQAVQGRTVVVDWPEGYPLTENVSASSIASLTGRKASKVVFTFGNDHREPMAPQPIVLRQEGGSAIVEVDSGAGKPPEMIRAIDRHLSGPAASAEISGKPVEVRIVGIGAVSRSMQRSLRDHTAKLGATRCVLVEQGVSSYLFPELLSISYTDDGVAIAADLAGRSEEQVRSDAATELGEIELEGRHVTLSPSPSDGLICEALVGRGAASVSLGGSNPRRLHPALISAARDDDGTVVLSPSPGQDMDSDLAALPAAFDSALETTGSMADARVRVLWPEALPIYDRSAQPPLLSEVVSRVLAQGPASIDVQAGDQDALPVSPRGAGGGITLLGQRSSAEPPLSLLGLPPRADHSLATLGYELETEAPAYKGHRILLTWPEAPLESDESDPSETPKPTQEERSIHKDGTMAAVIRHVLAGTGAALLLRQNDDEKHWFEVVASNHKDLPVGLRVKDPRPKKDETAADAETAREGDDEQGDPHDLASTIGGVAAATTIAGTAAAFSDSEDDAGDESGKDAPGDSDSGASDSGSSDSSSSGTD